MQLDVSIAIYVWYILDLYSTNTCEHAWDNMQKEANKL